MHPVFMQRMAAEHIKAMTEVADNARQARQARRTRIRKGIDRTNPRIPDQAAQPCPSREAMRWVQPDDISVTRSETAFGVRPGPATRAEER